MPALRDTGDLAPGFAADLPDRYEVVRVHGRGGMATVYLAVDRKHDRQVALKVLAPELTAGIGAERFIREIQIAAHLNHPHIVPLLDSGIADGRPYYVMPFVEGESLRDLLKREGSLPLEKAFEIAGDVAEALTYAHGHDVVHRDIKPGNILLTEGAAVVTDFGIAAAIDRAPDEHLTRTGHSLGSVGYMSPEQASGDDDVDGRADQYSLACVLFEMLSGRRPYEGRSARAVLGQQLSQPVPDLSTLCDDVPGELDAVVRRALARTPEDRFATAQEFAGALQDAVHRTGIAPKPATLRLRLILSGALAGAVLLAAAAWFLPGVGIQRLDSSPMVGIDTSTYAIFPFEHVSPDVDVRETRYLRRALAGWKGISLIDDFQLGEALDRTGQDTLDLEQAARVARSLGAGRFLVGEVERIGDSVSVRTGLFQVQPEGRTHLADGELVLPMSGEDTDSLFARHVVQLLWHGDPPSGSPTEVGTDVFPAWQAFEYGQRSIEDWDLGEAEIGFARATRRDPEYAEAYLWTALVRLWNGAERGSWGFAAKQAAQRLDRLTHRDSAIASALVHQADGDLGKACRSWDWLTREYPSHFTSWYGLALCLHSDHLVVADDTSPSGWAYRSSPHRAIEAFEQAFGRLPAILESFQSDSYASLQRLLLPSGHTARLGYALATDTIRFRAHPTLVNDTLAFVPRPTSEEDVRPAYEVGSQSNEAVRWQRRKFREIAAAWVSNAPQSAAAREAFAVALSMAGEPAALDTLVRARSLVDRPADAFRMAALEVWLRIAFGLPDDRPNLQRARVLADSLLEADAGDDRLAAGLAVLTGRGARAAQHARAAPSRVGVPGPPALAEDEAALLIFASLGGPADSLNRLGRDLMDRIEANVPESERAGLYAWYGLPASLAFATHPLPERERVPSDWLVEAQSAAEREDKSAVRRALEAVGTGRAASLPYSRTLDALFAEASLWAAIGDPAAAVRWLEPTLSVLPQVPNPVPNAWQAAALVRAAALRAELAPRVGDTRAAKSWGGAVAVLWSDADSFLQPLVERMRRLAQCPSC